MAERGDRAAHDGPGLRRRVQRAERSISDQHQQLDALFEDLLAALDYRDGHRARLVFLRFSDALNAHFSLEESFFFPALRGMHASAETELAALALEHQRFDADLARASELLRNDDFPGATGALDTLAAALSAHEKREESLVRTLVNAEEH